jgi:emp24/gp25L/p24 family/GOLD
LDIQVGEHAIDYANIAQKEKLSELQLRVRQLLDQVEQITKEQNYQRVRKLKCKVDTSVKKYFVFSIARRGSVRPVKALTRGCCGGR